MQMGLRLLELVVHGWDIRSALDPTAALAPESAAVLGFWGTTEQKTGLSRAPHHSYAESLPFNR